MNGSNMQKSDELYPILNELKNKGKLDGVIFAQRDGGLIKESLENQFDSQKIISMSASVLESAVGIGETIGNQKIKKVIAELAEKTILIFECNEKTFLILIINNESNVSYIFDSLEDIIRRIVNVY
ncbi:MAG: roadblock/LC7 domain-containing protein [Promethearchaeota archaeon]|nr:MAG: roadblock/LC7 domain-containing protein [Candidatus Lokiarchaeota archaeon]